MSNKQKVYKGWNGTLILTDTGVIIKRGLKGFFLGGGMIRGDKTIPYSSIVAVQFKKAGMLSGYLQLTIKGGPEAKGGLMQSVKDENTVTFQSWQNNKFEEVKRFIEEKISKNSEPKRDDIFDLEKLAELKEKGIITKEEFQKKKEQILKI